MHLRASSDGEFAAHLFIALGAKPTHARAQLPGKLLLRGRPTVAMIGRPLSLVVILQVLRRALWFDGLCRLGGLVLKGVVRTVFLQEFFELLPKCDTFAVRDFLIRWTLRVVARQPRDRSSPKHSVLIPGSRGRGVEHFDELCLELVHLRGGYPGELGGFPS